MATEVYRWLERVGDITSLLQLEVAGDNEVNLIAEEGQILFHAKVAALDRPCGLEANGENLVQGVDTRADQMRLQRDRFGDTMQREIADDGGGTLAGRYDLCRSEGRGRELGSIKPLIALKLVIEHRNRCKDRCHGDRDVQLRFAQLCRIELQASGSARKEAGEIGEAKVGNREADLGVMGLDLVGARLDGLRILRGDLRHGMMGAGDAEERGHRAGDDIGFHCEFFHSDR